MKLNILFVDDNSLFVKSAIHHLERQSILGTANNIEQLDEIFKQVDLNLDVIFIDLNLLNSAKYPNFCRNIRKKYPNTKIIGLSLFENEIICRNKKYSCIDYCIDKQNFYINSIYLIKALFS